eukprot:gene5819-6060_t
MPSSYCHNAQGINTLNLHSLAQPAPTARLPGGLRTDSDWKKEVDDVKQTGQQRGRLSSRLRDGNVELQASADLQVEQVVKNVESALQSKLLTTQALAHGLEQSLAAVSHELAGLSRSQQRLTDMAQRLQGKLTVNKARQQARSDRPPRELTCDQVNRSLMHQEGLLNTLMSRLQRGLTLVTADMEKLSSCKQQLGRDLKDKQAALQVDAAVLQVQPGDSNTRSQYGRKLATAVAGTSSDNKANSHSWSKKTETLLLEAQQLAGGASRAPLQQLEVRCHLRAGLPDSEAVQDEVQFAMAAEATRLAAVTLQLTQRAAAADQQIASLDDLSTALLRNIADKEAALSLEEKVALLDGRRVLAVPPTPSVLSVCSSVASGYSSLGESASQAGSRASTPSVAVRAVGADGCSVASGASVSSSALARIAALEQELAAAKVHTRKLQQTVQDLKLQQQVNGSADKDH